MNSQEPIFDYLVQPDNLSVALEIANYVDQLKHDMHKQFWSLYNPRMGQQLKLSSFTDAWRYLAHPASRYRSGWGTSFIGPTIEDNDKKVLRFAFGQAGRNSGFRLFWGAEWTTEPENFDQSAMASLRSVLITNNLTTVEKTRLGGAGISTDPTKRNFY